MRYAIVQTERVEDMLKENLRLLVDRFRNDSYASTVMNIKDMTLGRYREDAPAPRLDSVFG